MHIKLSELVEWWRKAGIAPVILQRIVLMGCLGRSDIIDIELFVTLACALLTMKFLDCIRAALNLLCNVDGRVPRARVRRILLFMFIVDGRFDGETVHDVMTDIDQLDDDALVNDVVDLLLPLTAETPIAVNSLSIDDGD